MGKLSCLTELLKHSIATQRAAAIARRDAKSAEQAQQFNARAAKALADAKARAEGATYDAAAKFGGHRPRKCIKSRDLVWAIMTTKASQ